MKKILFLFLLFVVLFISGCGNNLDPRSWVFIDGIKVINDENQEYNTLLLKNEEIAIFDNKLINSIKPIRQPDPLPNEYYYFAEIKEEKEIFIEIRIKVQDTVELTEMNLYVPRNIYNKNFDLLYSAENIEKEGNIFIAKFKVNCNEDVFFRIGRIKLTVDNREINGYTQDHDPESYSDQGHYNIVLRKYDYVSEYKKIVNIINDGLNTDYKLFDDVTGLINEINNLDFTKGYLEKNYWIFEKENDVIINETNYKNYDHLCFKYSVVQEICYIDQIFFNIEDYYLFGITKNSSIEEMKQKMNEFVSKTDLRIFDQYHESGHEKYYFYNIDDSFIEITFCYNKNVDKLLSIKLTVNTSRFYHIYY